MARWLTVIGIGEAGIAALPPSAQLLIDAAQTVIGPKRFLPESTPTLSLPSRGREPSPSSDPIAPQSDAASSLPSPLRGGDGGGGNHPKYVEWRSPLTKMLAQVEALRGTPTVILATGDPGWFGIGATLAKHLGADEYAIVPHLSSFQLAASRMHWPLQDVATLSLHGRPVELLHPHLLPGNRILALTSDASQLAVVRQLLASRGYRHSWLTILENLGGDDERVASGPAGHFDQTVGDFYVLAIECVADPGALLLPPLPGLPDDAFVSDGQLTKREVRAITVARLAPHPGALLWDVGAGSGSIAIEWMRSARDAHAIAFEREGERLQMIAVNAAALGVPALDIVSGDAPETFAGKPAPDAIFIGGGLATLGLAERCWEALKPGGRLVVNTVTVEGELALFALYHRFGGDVCRIDIAQLDKVGAFHALRPKMPVTQFWVTKR